MPATTTTCQRWRLEIPGWRPALLNELLGRHPMSVARRKAHDRRILGRALVAYGVPRATGPRGVHLEITGRFGVFPDPDSPWKSLLDALVRCGALVDDSAEFCHWTPATFRRGAPGTVIELRDL